MSKSRTDEAKGERRRESDIEKRHRETDERWHYRRENPYKNERREPYRRNSRTRHGYSPPNKYRDREDKRYTQRRRSPSPKSLRTRRKRSRSDSSSYSSSSNNDKNHPKSKDDGKIDNKRSNNRRSDAIRRDKDKSDMRPNDSQKDDRRKQLSPEPDDGKKQSQEDKRQRRHSGSSTSSSNSSDSRSSSSSNSKSNASETETHKTEQPAIHETKDEDIGDLRDNLLRRLIRKHCRTRKGSSSQSSTTKDCSTSTSLPLAYASSNIAFNYDEQEQAFGNIAKSLDIDKGKSYSPSEGRKSSSKTKRTGPQVSKEEGKKEEKPALNQFSQIDSRYKLDFEWSVKQTTSAEISHSSDNHKMADGDKISAHADSKRLSFDDYESKIKPSSCFDEPISNKIAFSFGSPPRKREKFEAKLPTQPKTNQLSSEQLADIPLPAGPVPMAIDSSAPASSATIFSPAISNVCANNKFAGERLATSMAPVFVLPPPPPPPQLLGTGQIQLSSAYSQASSTQQNRVIAPIKDASFYDRKAYELTPSPPFSMQSMQFLQQSRHDPFSTAPTAFSGLNVGDNTTTPPSSTPFYRAAGGSASDTGTTASQLSAQLTHSASIESRERMFPSFSLPWQQSTQKWPTDGVTTQLPQFSFPPPSFSPFTSSPSPMQTPGPSPTPTTASTQSTDTDSRERERMPSSFPTMKSMEKIPHALSGSGAALTPKFPPLSISPFTSPSSASMKTPTISQLPQFDPTMPPPALPSHSPSISISKPKPALPSKPKPIPLMELSLPPIKTTTERTERRSFRYSNSYDSEEADNEDFDAQPETTMASTPYYKDERQRIRAPSASPMIKAHHGSAEQIRPPQRQMGRGGRGARGQFNRSYLGDRKTNQSADQRSHQMTRAAADNDVDNESYNSNDKNDDDSNSRSSSSFSLKFKSPLIRKNTEPEHQLQYKNSNNYDNRRRFSDREQYNDYGDEATESQREFGAGKQMQKQRRFTGGDYDENANDQIAGGDRRQFRRHATTGGINDGEPQQQSQQTENKGNSDRRRPNRSFISANNSNFGFIGSSTSPDKSPRPRMPRIIERTDGRGRIAPFFTNAYAFSNHYICKFTIDGREFNCSEQYYMYYKALVFGATDLAEQIMEEKNPKEMKRLCADPKQIPNFDPMKWNLISVKVMAIACYQKFAQNRRLMQLLFETGDAELVEAAPMDRFWGIGLGIDDPNVNDISRWDGVNMLGNVLTTVRDRLSQKYPQVHAFTMRRFHQRMQQQSQQQMHGADSAENHPSPLIKAGGAGGDSSAPARGIGLKRKWRDDNIGDDSPSTSDNYTYAGSGGGHEQRPQRSADGRLNAGNYHGDQQQGRWQRPLIQQQTPEGQSNFCDYDRRSVTGDGDNRSGRGGYQLRSQPQRMHEGQFGNTDDEYRGGYQLRQQQQRAAPRGRLGVCDASNYDYGR